MSKKYTIGCTYFSLPQFPEDCNLINNSKLLLRDVLVCNKNNQDHFNSAGQYDPHLEHRPPQYRYCHANAKAAIFNRREDYDDLYILFWTNYLYADGRNQHRVVGYYQVNQKSFRSLDEGAPTLYAKSAKFVNLEDTINITKSMKKFNLYQVCPSNENPKYQDVLNRLLKTIMEGNQKNQLEDYRKETKRLDRIFNKNEPKKYYPQCEGCFYLKEKNKTCPLIWRIYYSGWSRSGFCDSRKFRYRNRGCDPFKNIRCE